MTLKKLWLLAFMYCAPAMVAQAMAAEPQELRGTAVSVDDGRVLYTEYHRWQDAWHRAEYRAPDGTLLAVNELDYSSGRSQPAFMQTDKITGATEGARWDGTVLTLFRGSRSKVMAYREPLVISSGFNNFILEHWGDLIANRVWAVDFAVPQHLLIVGLKVRRITVDESYILNPNPDWIYLRVLAANPILSWFVDPVDLAYSPDRLLRVYRGSSNLEIDGRMPVVEIRY